MGDRRESTQGLQVPSDILDLSDDELRRLGYWVVDRTIEHLATLRDRPAISVASADDLRAALGGPFPSTGVSLEDTLALLADVALENQQHGDHPRYFARVPAPAAAAAILGDWLATGMSSVASSWGGGSGSTMLELTVLEWLRDAVGLAPTSEGILASGGSLANVTALLTARHERGPGVAYLADQAHSSIARGLRTTGWAPDDIRLLPTDASYRLDPGTVAQAIGDDLRAGRTPAIVVGTAGTTNTGAVDDITGLADVCAQHGLWLHVDGAYGGPAAMLPDHGGIHGLSRADSFVLDPHKWLFQPYDVACVWVAHPGALERTFAMYPEYLRDTDLGEVDLHNRSLELSRRSRAAKLWVTLRSLGHDAVVAAISRGVALAQEAQGLIESIPGMSVVTPAQLGIVTFALDGHGDAEHRAVAAAVTADGVAALTSTVLSGRTVLRLCTISPRTTVDDLRMTMDAVAAYAAS